MSKLPLPLDTDAYLADTGHLSTTEHGAYLLLLMAIWRSKDGWLPDDDGYLARATHLTLDRWRRIAVTIRALLHAAGGRVTQKRAQRERQSVRPSQNTGLDSGRVSKSLKNLDLVPETPPKTAELVNGALTLTSLDSESKKKEGKQVSRASRTLLAADWTPSAANLDYAAEHGFELSAVKLLAVAFADFHRSRGNRMADWDAAWRTWVRNEIKFNGGRNGRTKRSLLDAIDNLPGDDAGADHQAGGARSLQRLPPR